MLIRDDPLLIRNNLVTPPYSRPLLIRDDPLTIRDDPVSVWDDPLYKWDCPLITRESKIKCNSNESNKISITLLYLGLIYCTVFL